MPTAAPPAATISEEEVSALLDKKAADGPRPYDFTAQRINRTPLPLLEVVSKSFADRAAFSRNDGAQFRRRLGGRVGGGRAGGARTREAGNQPPLGAVGCPQ